LTALSCMTSSGSGALRDRVLVVPLGATEQHGPHLPLTTDTDIAQTLAERLAAVDERVVVAPAVAYGASDEHQSFAGTLSIGADVTERLLIELGRSATRTWPRVLLLSTHGGNATAVSNAAAQLHAEGRDVRVWSPRWRGDAHAGHIETSLMLATHAERVDVAAASPGAREPIDTLMPRLRREGIAPVSPNGVLGDPTTADATAGARLVNDALVDLSAFLSDWRRQAA
jgi:mycofactocin precursor peptide peptidase